MKNQSLQDQLLNAGLINKTKAKEVKTEKRKQTQKQRKNKVEVVDEAKLLAQQAKAKQIDKDKQLNDQRNKQAEKKQIANQILQLINLNKIDQDEEGVAYNFTDNNKVKTIYISDDIRNKIIAGKLAIVKASTQYQVVPVQVAEKIKQRNMQAIIVLFEEQADSSGDNDYQGFEIPDDLMW